MSETSETYTVRQVASILDLHQNTIYRYISEGKLPSIKASIGKIKVAKADLERFILSNDIGVACGQVLA